MSNLKPCPFCGGEARLNGYKNCHWVICMNMDCLSSYGINQKTEEEAILSWNTRTPDQPESIEEKQ